MFLQQSNTTSPIWIPLFASALSFLGLVVATSVSWWKDSNRQAKRVQLWDEAKKAVDYWDAYVKLVGAALPSDDERVQQAKLFAFIEAERIRAWLGEELHARSALTTDHLLVHPKSIRELLEDFLLLTIDMRGKEFFLLRIVRISFWCCLVYLFSIPFGFVVLFSPKLHGSDLSFLPRHPILQLVIYEVGGPLAVYINRSLTLSLIKERIATSVSSAISDGISEKMK